MFVPLTAVVPVTARVGVDAPEIVTALYLPAVISPVVSAIVTAEFWISSPVVPLNRTTALSVALAGPTTSPDPPPPPPTTYSTSIPSAVMRGIFRALSMCGTRWTVVSAMWVANAETSAGVRGVPRAWKSNHSIGVALLGRAARKSL